jgi:hypothetical protein
MKYNGVKTNLNTIFTLCMIVNIDIEVLMFDLIKLSTFDKFVPEFKVNDLNVFRVIPIN